MHEFRFTRVRVRVRVRVCVRVCVYGLQIMKIYVLRSGYS
jgi:hypothetical protein